MKAWLVKRLADPEEALSLEEVPEPVPRPGQVCIQVEAAALNFFDILLCQGKYQEKPPLPFTPGAEIAGTILSVGEGSRFQPGQRVIATPQLPHGGLAEKVAVDDHGVFPIPEGMPAEKAAAMFITYHTTYYALHNRARLQSGEVLLVHAGSGGVGSAAIQLGKAAGARVIATAGGPEKVQVCRDLGADVAIDYLQEDFVEIVKRETGGRGADVIYDPVGGDTFDRSRKCIAFDGRILVIGFAGGRIADAPTNHALVKNYAIVGVHWGLFRRLYPEQVVEEHRRLMELFEEGAIDPLIFRVYPLEQVPQALKQLGGRRTWGKLVVKP